MKKLMLLAAGIATSALIVLAGCTSAQQQNLAILAAQAQANVVKACAVVQPVLLDLSASIPADPNLALLAADNGKLCTAVATLDPTNAQSLVNTVIPQAIGLVSLLPIDAGTQATIRLALGAASLALSNWLAVYGTPSTAAVLATAPTAASAPIAASQ
ncbi:hypothetical protein C7405_101626 [Paraburkholderia caballeronis]|uniref:hypothetical protein n=1 Tax=Paraburkholderia caballeronis TaxID=416943 RepID=UPI001064EAD5|nr:hypothetical protein [Paraburkholderia caballeronis]TDV39507.1 hypothetical protein C7405_101626 [Paraburkholderia caballeronis]